MELLARYLSPRLREYFVRSKEVRDGSSLTDREAQVVRLVAQGMSNRLITAELHIRVDTVKKHVMPAMQKTGAGNRTQLALFHLRWRVYLRFDIRALYRISATRCAANARSAESPAMEAPSVVAGVLVVHGGDL